MTPRDYALQHLTFTRRATDALLDGIPDDKLTFQASPTDNHALWIMGHLADIDTWFASVLRIDGITVPPAWPPIFSTGSRPSPDRAAYPPISEIRERYNTNRQLIINWASAATDQQLTTPLTDRSGGFAKDPLDLLLKIAWHETWHTGQLASARRALGLPPAHISG